MGLVSCRSINNETLTPSHRTHTHTHTHTYARTHTNTETHTVHTQITYIHTCTHRSVKDIMGSFRKRTLFCEGTLRERDKKIEGAFHKIGQNPQDALN